MFSDKFGEFELIRWKAMAKSEKEVLVDFFIRNYENQDLTIFEQHFM